MSESWHGLLASSGIVALFIALWSHLPMVVACATAACRVVFGLIFGVGAISCMGFAVEVQTGVFLDLRNVLIVTASFIGGPLAGLVSAALAAAYRLHLGGDGVVPALVTMAGVVLVGSLVHLRLKGRPPQRIDALVLALLFTGFSLLVYAVFPGIRLTPSVMVDTTIFRFFACLLAALAMAKEVRRQGMARANLIYGALTEALPDCLNVKDADGKFIVANTATAKLMQASAAADLIGKSDFDFYPGPVARQFRQLESDIIASRATSTVEQFVTHRDGSTAWLSTMKVPVFDEKNRFQGLITHNRDITARKQLEADLARVQRRLQLTFANMLVGVAMFDDGFRLVFCNERYQEMFPLTADVRRPGARFKDIIRASLERGEKGLVSAAEIEEQVARSEQPILSPTSVPFKLGDGRWIEARINPTSGGYFVVYADISDQKRSEQVLQSLNAKLEELSQVDPLTGLLNRRAMDAFLDDELARCARGRGPTSVLLIDVDKFKAFNDTYGHLGGDECLQRVARCLKDGVRRTTDRVARYGGEEFAVILSGTPLADAQDMADQLRSKVEALAIAHSGSPFRVVTISVGVATISSGASCDRMTIIQLADEALYRAKGAGRNQVMCAASDFDQSQRAAAV